MHVVRLVRVVVFGVAATLARSQQDAQRRLDESVPSPGSTLPPVVATSAAPSPKPTSDAPTPKPSNAPTFRPTTAKPTTAAPSPRPSTARPTTSRPSLRPSPSPSLSPTPGPSPKPTFAPSPSPTTSRPSSSPSPEPTPQPTPKPSPRPTPSPSEMPTPEPTTAAPSTATPSSSPTPMPSTAQPSSTPTPAPTSKPTSVPTSVPTSIPTSRPTPQPSSRPTWAPTNVPTSFPTAVPSPVPSPRPTFVPTPIPSVTPTSVPTPSPSPAPTVERDDNSGGDTPSPLVIGIAAGGALLLVLLCCALCIWCRKKKRTKKDSMMSSDDSSDIEGRSRQMIDPADVSVELEQDSRRANFVDDSEFADWDFNAGDAPAVEASADISRRVVGSTLESYAARRRGRVVTVDDANDVASVKWLENDPFAHALVRRLTLATEIDENAKPTKTTAFFPGESLSLGSAVEGFQVPLVPGDNDLKAAVLRADVWPFDQRRQAVVKALDRMRIPHAVGRVELKVRRETCYRSALKGYRDLGLRAWRMGWFINFHRESGLDAGGLSREFWRLTLAHAFSEEAGLFARTENGSYDCVDAIEDEIKERLPEYRFVGRCLGKLLFDRHSGCLEAAVNVKIFKLLVGEPVVFDDLQLVDEQLWLSLTKLEALSNNNPDRLSDLELNFAVDRRSFLSGRSSTVELEPGGADVLVDADNIDRFLEARMREVLFDKHKDQLLALLAGFHDICPPSVLLLLTARELELALCGEQHVDMEDWKANTVYRGAFETEKADHPVCAAFWRTVESWSDQRRTRLLQWSIGTARLPLGGFRNLQQRDGVSRQFTLTSVDPSNAIYPRSHTCFNRIDLPLYANPEREVPNALEFVVTHATAEFTLD